MNYGNISYALMAFALALGFTALCLHAVRVYVYGRRHYWLDQRLKAIRNAKPVSVHEQRTLARLAAYTSRRN